MTHSIKIIRGAHNVPAELIGSVATIGNFDGVHLGHQALLQQLQQSAQDKNLPSVVISFEPLPLEVFSPQSAPPRLATLRDKLPLLAQFGVDYLMLLAFNRRMAAWDAPEFVQKILIDALKIQHLVIGDDFRFGSARGGDVHLLTQLGRQYGFSVAPSSTVLSADMRISSTRIRQALGAGEMTAAAQLLGRAYSMAGKVVHGDQRGRELGYPTANILLKRPKSPVNGVFVVRALVDGKWHNGVANVGSRPTVGGLDARLEVHLFDFHQDIYGKLLKVEFLAKIRAEQKFANLNQLTAAIAQDNQEARAFFAAQNS